MIAKYNLMENFNMLLNIRLGYPNLDISSFWTKTVSGVPNRGRTKNKYSRPQSFSPKWLNYNTPGADADFTKQI